MSLGKISSAATIYYIWLQRKTRIEMAMSSQKMDFHNKNPHLHKIQRENA